MKFTNATSLPFGNQTINIGNNGLKYAMLVEGWNFQSLQNRMVVHVASGASLGAGDCQTTNLGTSDDNVRWINIRVGNVSLYPHLLFIYLFLSF